MNRTVDNPRGAEQPADDVILKALDVSNDEGVRGLAAELEQEFGPLDVLDNNAAAYADWSEMASSADLGLAQGVLGTNLFGAWRATALVVRPPVKEVPWQIES